MFRCYVHGWNHIENPCPICYQPTVVTSNSCIIEKASASDPLGIFDSMREEINELKHKNSQLDSALRYSRSKYDKALITLKELAGDDCSDPFCQSLTRATEALKKLGEQIK